MTAHKSSRLTEMLAGIKRTWSELDYANRRMFDIRTGQHFTERQSDSEPRRSAARRTAAPAH